MRLAPGQSLLHFRLVAKIGEGGMGEVWRAVDGTLDREVAIKVLPPELAGDADRLARLEREAKLLASLNHPNIAAIYGFPEAADPGSSAPVRFLAMELVRGEDLAQIVARGPMPVRDALEAAKQVASALEAAHDSGVVHRDLKPANVKRTPEGQVKVLDFGLAKSLETATPATLHSATVTSAGSQAGMILGTASYMSPEAARGQIVDRRTDLWAFGCLLYEMLAGRKAFDGPTVTDVLAAVVTGEPDWSRLPPSTPASVRRLLRRCLEKDVRKRLRDAGDASLLLDDNPDDARTAPVPAARSSRAPALAAIAIVAGALGVALGRGLFHGAGTPKADPAVSFHRITYGRGMMRAARFAPDGRTIVYGAAWGGPPVKLYLARTDSADSTPLPMPPGELFAISKRGEMAVGLGLAYYGWMADGTLAQASVLGGSAREILEHVRSADWSPDGSQLAIVRRVENFDRLEFPPGTELDKTTGYFADVRVSPDGERVAYADHPSYGDNRGRTAVVDRAGKKTILAPDLSVAQGVAWAPGGTEVWFTGQSGDSTFRLEAVDLAGHRRTVYATIGDIELFDVAGDGRVLLANQRPEKGVLGFMAGFADPRPLLVAGESSLARTISRDGRAALVANQIPKEYETFLVRSDGSSSARLGPGDGMAIAPDGRSALLSSADYKTFFVVPLGVGATRQVPNPDHIDYEGIPAWLPGGKHLVVAARKNNEPARGFVIDVASGAGTPFGAPGLGWAIYNPPPVSPDGKAVVLQDPSGTLMRWPIAGGDPVAIPGLLPGDKPLTWTDDGSALFVAGQSLPITIERLDLATGKRTPWKTLAPSDAAGLRFAVASITPDGKYWALNTGKLFTDLYVAEGLR
jgi:hypothetical protein